MRLIKMLGLAVAAALTAMAMIGAGSASATVLCTVTPGAGNKCPTGEAYGVGTVIKGTSVNAELTSDLSNVLCTHSETEAVVTSSPGGTEPVTGEVKKLTFTGCKTSGLVGCTVTVKNLPYHAEVTSNGEHGNGTLTVTPSEGKGEPGATVVCLGVINCTFSNTLFELDVFGGNPAKVVANEEPLNREGGLCGKEAFWDAEYVATSPKNVWVAHE